MLPPRSVGEFVLTGAATVFSPLAADARRSTGIVLHSSDAISRIRRSKTSELVDAPMTGKTPTKTEVEPNTRTDLQEFLDQFDSEHVFGITYHCKDDEHQSYRIVTAIEKVRPAAVPIDQPTTFDMEVVETGEDLGDELRLTIEDIEHVRAAEFSDNPRPEGDGV